jgi:hypothetical protein
LGLPSDYPPEYLSQEKRWLSSKLGTSAEGKIVHQVTYKGKLKNKKFKNLKIKKI